MSQKIIEDLQNEFLALKEQGLYKTEKLHKQVPCIAREVMKSWKL